VDQAPLNYEQADQKPLLHQAVILFALICPLTCLQG